MKILLVTEKCSSTGWELDGGARLVNTLQQAFENSLSIMQFGPEPDNAATWHYKYPIHLDNRFARRLANASFIAEKVKSVENYFTHVLFIHVSMQFGLVTLPLRKELQIWTFPMFLTPSYEASGERIPPNYLEMERRCLESTQNILTPSHLEKRQLIDFYSIPKERIHVVPRGVDTRILRSKQRFLHEPPKFCSVGSIKPQKNTLGLIQLFAEILATHPNAFLKVIGPVQNSFYYEDVCSEINRLGLNDHIEMTGHVPPHQLAMAIEDAHLHLSTSTCETFGRSIFETLASGLPNIARAQNNAAAEYLAHLPYVFFSDQKKETLEAVNRMLENLPKLSKMAIEVGQFYDEQMLSNLLAAKICQKEILAISDFDGTLFHKDDPIKTKQCIQAFRSYPIKILCSARPIQDLLEQLKNLGLTVDWIVGCSGSIVADGNGKRLWHIPLDFDDICHLEGLIPQCRRIEMNGDILQLAIEAEFLPSHYGLRAEIYQGIAFISHWEASKFRAIHRLLRHINWLGRVAAFGDGPYDAELLNYFDGILITKDNVLENHKQQESLNV